jgi:hypothetical protein
VMYGRLPSYHLRRRPADGRAGGKDAAGPRRRLPGGLRWATRRPAPLATALGLPVHLDERLLGRGLFQGKRSAPAGSGRASSWLRRATFVVLGRAVRAHRRGCSPRGRGCGQHGRSPSATNCRSGRCAGW